MTYKKEGPSEFVSEFLFVCLLFDHFVNNRLIFFLLLLTSYNFYSTTSLDRCVFSSTSHVIELMIEGGGYRRLGVTGNLPFVNQFKNYFFILNK